jgi:hypothetical protein
MNTTVLPSFSGRAAICAAAQSAAPDEMPASRPSVFASSRAAANASSALNGDDLVANAYVHHLGHKPRAEPLNLIRPGRLAGKHGGFRGFDGDNLDLRVLRL